MNELLLYSLFAFSIFNSLWHLYEENKGKLWRYFGAIAGVKINDTIGSFFFTFLLGVTLLTSSITGILGIDILGLYPSFCLANMAFLIGARLSDSWNSHFRLQKLYQGNRGYKGNPGYLSSINYMVEGGLLIILLISYFDYWNPAQEATSVIALLLGLITGVLLFIIVIPVIKFIAKKFAKEALKTAWEPQQAIPKWAE